MCSNLNVRDLPLRLWGHVEDIAKDTKNIAKSPTDQRGK
jgi:hypothetical protein